MSRSPTLEDGLFYYGADALSMNLERGLKRELGKRNPDGWMVLFGVLGLAGSEMMKASINGQVSPPFRTITAGQDEKRRRREA